MKPPRGCHLWSGSQGSFSACSTSPCDVAGHVFPFKCRGSSKGVGGQVQLPLRYRIDNTRSPQSDDRSTPSATSCSQPARSLLKQEEVPRFELGTRLEVPAAAAVAGAVVETIDWSSPCRAHTLATAMDRSPLVIQYSSNTHSPLIKETTVTGADGQTMDWRAMATGSVIWPYHEPIRKRLML